MKKLVSLLFLFVCLPAIAQPLSLSEWQRPYINRSISNQDFTSVLNCEKKTPYYVFYNLFPGDFSGVVPRKDKWLSYVPQDIKNICGPSYATTKNYANSGYDRGHLAPAGDFNSSQIRENITFSFANAAPQNKTLNRGEWEQLEEYERQSAVNHNGITVITGVIQSPNNYIKGGVGVPDYYYKIILWNDAGRVNNQAFIARNIASKPQQIPIRELENLSGMNFGL